MALENFNTPRPAPGPDEIVIHIPFVYVEDPSVPATPAEKPVFPPGTPPDWAEAAGGTVAPLDPTPDLSKPWG